ncbi:hypothetical protein IIO_02540 [Bacillus cereus VD115]|nr:hypothetical protein IIO_02540 [Bacillus cereus VD115]
MNSSYKIQLSSIKTSKLLPLAPSIVDNIFTYYKKEPIEGSFLL